MQRNKRDRENEMKRKKFGLVPIPGKLKDEDISIDLSFNDNQIISNRSIMMMGSQGNDSNLDQEMEKKKLLMNHVERIENEEYSFIKD